MISATISPQDFKLKLETGDYVLFDVRTLQEFSQGSIPGAEVLDMKDPTFLGKLQAFDKHKKYLIYCRSGARTSVVLDVMRQLGFEEVYDLKGGMLNWS